MKIVVVGLNAAGLSYLKDTPLGVMTDMEISAQAIETDLTDTQLIRNGNTNLIEIVAVFVFGFLQSLIFTYFGYVTVNHSEAAKMDGVKYTAEAYIAPAGFTVINTLLLYGLSDKIYS